ncbi:VOC family protein, partial [Micromonospora sp. WMMB482]|uniref:VOC family protein n=1 Tax=Micromonospora sp. WMMB482 TaxID=2849653 RepID=UPI0027DEADAC
MLSVSDVERSLDFYCATLGLAPVRVDRWGRRGAVPVRTRRRRHHHRPGAGRAGGSNVDHFCLVVE